MVMLFGYFLQLMDLVFPRVPEFLDPVGVISFLVGIPVFIVGLLRRDRQSGTVQDIGS